ncbi:MAG: phage BR0599 family protein [Candidatus Devosia symbiotica]|nr:phage BR0599 family protein [Candidatus Devosia symbiotica]
MRSPLCGLPEKFANAVNFRGFPHISGSDYVLRHPRHGDALDGKAVVP